MHFQLKVPSNESEKTQHFIYFIPLSTLFSPLTKQIAANSSNPSRKLINSLKTVSNKYGLPIKPMLLSITSVESKANISFGEENHCNCLMRFNWDD